MLRIKNYPTKPIQYGFFYPALFVFIAILFLNGCTSKTKITSDRLTTENLAGPLEGHWIHHPRQGEFYGYVFRKDGTLTITRDEWEYNWNLQFVQDGKNISVTKANGEPYLSGVFEIKDRVLNIKGSYPKGKPINFYMDSLQKKAEDVFRKKVPVFFLLKEKKYEELIRLLEEKQQQWEQNPEKELDLYLTYQQFRINDPEAEVLFNEFIDAYPNSYLPHLLRGIYFMNLGYNYRGGSFSKETPFTNYIKMQSAHEKSDRDLTKSVELANKEKPEFVPIAAYYAWIDLRRYGGNEKEVETMEKESLKIFPLSFFIRYRILIGYLPRWYGSIRKMQSIVDDAQAYAEKNPLLKKLQSVVDSESANQEIKSGNGQTGLEMYRENLKKYQFPPVYEDIARTSYDRKKWKEAIPNYLELLDSGYLSEMRKYEFEYLSDSFAYSNKLTESIYYLQLGLKYNPKDKNLMHLLFWRYHSMDSIVKQSKYSENLQSFIRMTTLRLRMRTEFINPSEKNLSLFRNRDMTLL